MNDHAEQGNKSNRWDWTRRKAWTLVVGIPVFALAIITVPMLTRIPVISVGTLLQPFTFIFTLAAVVLLVAAGLLVWSRRTAGRVLVAAVAGIAALSTGIMSGSAIAFASNYGIQFSAGDIVPAAPSNLIADAEIDSYTTFDGKDVGLSVWKPASQAPGETSAPVLVWVHGGAWTLDTRFTPAERSAASGFADEGYMVVSLDYSTSDAQHQNWDVQESQVGCALTWVAAHAAEYGGDASKLVLGGASAGGNIAFNVGAKAARGELTSSCGGEIPEVDVMTIVVGASSPAAVWETSDPLLQPLLRPELTKHVGGSPDEYPERYAAMESINAISPETPPTVWLYGTNDHLVPRDSTDRMLEALRAADVPVVQMLVPFADHSVNAGIVNEAWRAETVRFAAEHGVK